MTACKSIVLITVCYKNTAVITNTLVQRENTPLESQLHDSGIVKNK